MNVADSERIMGQLEDMGVVAATEEQRKDANVVILNTCSIRDHAEQKVRQNLLMMITDNRYRHRQPHTSFGGRFYIGTSAGRAPRAVRGRGSGGSERGAQTRTQMFFCSLFLWCFLCLFPN